MGTTYRVPSCRRSPTEKLLLHLVDHQEQISQVAGRLRIERMGMVDMVVAQDQGEEDDLIWVVEAMESLLENGDVVMFLQEVVDLDVDAEDQEDRDGE